MKKWMLALAALMWFAPVKGTDVGKLLPVELVSLRKDGEALLVQTDTGDIGIGDTLDAAMRDLKRGAPGEIFLETADYLVLSANSREVWAGLADYFRPGTLVFLMEEPVDPGKTAQYLRPRQAGIPLNEVEQAARLPMIRTEEGRVELEE